MRYSAPTSRKVRMYTVRSTVQYQVQIYCDEGHLRGSSSTIQTKNTKNSSRFRNTMQRQLLAVIQCRVTNAYLLHTAKKIKFMYSQK
jgi:hypothetical protein